MDCLLVFWIGKAWKDLSGHDCLPDKVKMLD